MLFTHIYAYNPPDKKSDVPYKKISQQRTLTVKNNEKLYKINRKTKIKNEKKIKISNFSWIWVQIRILLFLMFWGLGDFKNCFFLPGSFLFIGSNPILGAKSDKNVSKKWQKVEKQIEKIRTCKSKVTCKFSKKYLFKLLEAFWGRKIIAEDIWNNMHKKS